jgi:hypothetical protein
MDSGSMLRHMIAWLRAERKLTRACVRLVLERIAADKAYVNIQQAVCYKMNTATLNCGLSRNT